MTHGLIWCRIKFIYIIVEYSATVTGYPISVNDFVKTSMDAKYDNRSCKRVPYCIVQGLYRKMKDFDREFF